MRTSTATPVDWNTRVRRILSGNAKLLKSPAGPPAVVVGVSMAPAKRSGVVNVCEHATAACIAACVLWFAGRTVTASVRAAAVARTMLWAMHPAVFYARLRRELRSLVRRADRDGKRVFVRLNTASDIDHGPEITREFPTVTWYDYSKDVDRVLSVLSGSHGPNYYVSLSVHEESTFDDVSRVINAGGNVVVVVDSYYWGPTRRYGVLPANVLFVGPAGQRLMVGGRDGDLADPRTPEFDGRGNAVCLRLKGQSRKTRDRARSSGFARPFTLGGREHSERFSFPAPRGTMVVRLK